MAKENELTFRQWLTENGYYQPERAWELLAGRGGSEEELAKLDEEYDELEIRYINECDELGYESYFD